MGVHGMSDLAGDFEREKTKTRRTPRRRCRICGCTDTRACPGGCFWVEPDLCSSCASPSAWQYDPEITGKIE
jgi:hypothetical protein